MFRARNAGTVSFLPLATAKRAEPYSIRAVCMCTGHVNADSGLKKDSDNATINTMDITNEWTKQQNNTGQVIRKQEYTVSGTAYKVDGHHVVLEPSKMEVAVAELLANKYGKKVELVPQIMYPTGIQTPDYLIDGERFDLKSPTGSGKYLIKGLIAKKRKQADNFVIDVSDCPLDIEEIDCQIKGLYTSPQVGFVRKIVLIKNGKVVKVYNRK